MARYHMTSDGRVPFTEQEEADRDVQEQLLADKQVELKKTQYQRDRKAEYDKLNQFEMMFDDQRDGTTTWVDAINEIKKRHPKK